MNRRRIVLSIFTLILSETINKLTPLLILRYARINLGITYFGHAQFSLIFIESIAPLLSLGSSLLGAIKINRSSNLNNSDSSSFTFNLIFAKLINLLLISVILILFILNSDLYQYRWYILCSSILLISTVFETDFVHLGNQTMIKRNIFIIIGKIVGLISVVFFVRKETDIYLYIIISCLPLCLLSLFSFINNLKYIKLKIPSLYNLINLYKECAPYALLFFLFTFIDRFDFFMIKIFYSNYEVGIYASHLRIVQAVSNSLISLGLLFFSESLVARTKEQTKKIFEYDFSSLLVIYPPILILSLFFANDILYFIFDTKHGNMSDLQPILLFGSLLSQIVLLFGIRILMVKGNIKKVNIVTIFSILIGIISSFFLKDNFSLYGIAFGQLISKFISCIFLGFLSIKYIDTITFNNTVIKSYYSCIIMMTSFLIPIENLKTKLVLGISLYIISSLVMCHKEIKNILLILFNSNKKFI